METKFTEFKSRAQIAGYYGISARTLSRKLKAAGIKIDKGLISPKIQIQIHKLFSQDWNRQESNEKDFE